MLYLRPYIPFMVHHEQHKRNYVVITVTLSKKLMIIPYTYICSKRVEIASKEYFDGFISVNSAVYDVCCLRQED